jgi:segregation and condensation protein B
MDNQRIKYIVESVLLAAGKPLGLDQLLAVFGDGERPERDDIREAVTALQQDYAERGIELVEVASGYRIQVSQSMEPWVSRLTEEKPARYSRALLETLALVAYRQPITRGEIEDIRGVSVSSSIMKTLQEREWVRVVGHRDVPGRPAMYGTTRQFLDYFNLNGLDDLPTLMELRDIDTINAELDLELPGQEHGRGDDEAVDERADAASPAAVQVPVDVADSNGTLH